MIADCLFSVGQSGTVINRMSADSSSCNCLIDVDSTFTLALSQTDDGTTSKIFLPFTFCFYGQNIDSVYINNNGNISFDPYGMFSSLPFPSSGNSMIAPFWADVDTRDTLGGIGINGNVYYKITPTAFIVRWKNVGYYYKQSDKLNDFQLILSNSLDTLIPGGNNLQFCYGDMQWTTGSASGGVSGFGGVPSTAGVNKGDGVEYMQVGRFDQAGLVYDGGYGANDGVDWLDNKTVIMNTCGTTVSSIALDEFCDTVSISSSLSYEEFENSFQLKIFPNPANNFIDVETDFEKCYLSVFDITGKLILKHNIDQDKTRIDISDLANGLYYIRLLTEEKQISRKIIKQ